MLKKLILYKCNCLYRVFSYYLYGDQEHYNEIRKNIYENRKKNKEEIREFFLEDKIMMLLLIQKKINLGKKLKMIRFIVG